MSGDLVSIITPAYNAERFVVDTIRSVQAQTHKNWEMWIADDGSKDSTARLVEEEQARDPRIHLIRLPGNGGPALARQAALERARGRYIAFLDSDDLWLPRKLERQIEFMSEKNRALSFSSYRRVSQDLDKVGRLISVPEVIDYKALLRHNVIATLTAMVDVSLTGRLKMTNEGYDDFILWLGLTKRGFKAHGLNEDLARYRIVGGSVSRKRSRAARWVWTIYRKVERLPLWYAAWNFMLFSFFRVRKHTGF